MMFMVVDDIDSDKNGSGCYKNKEKREHTDLCLCVTILTLKRAPAVAIKKEAVKHNKTSDGVTCFQVISHVLAGLEPFSTNGLPS